MRWWWVVLVGCSPLKPVALGDVCGDGTNDVVMRVTYCPEKLDCLRTGPQVESFRMHCAVSCGVDGGCPSGCSCRAVVSPTCWKNDTELCAAE
ncbi:MAG: hypothetical protein ABTQ32_22135 [Myxococcaceae bacterium]